MSADLVRLTLVPVEVFGMDGCGDPDCAHCRRYASFGLCDAVSSWSDCNRAEGHIYRVDEPESEPYRLDGETVVIYVERANLPFFDVKWGDE